MNMVGAYSLSLKISGATYYYSHILKANWNYRRVAQLSFAS